MTGRRHGAPVTAQEEARVPLTRWQVGWLMAALYLTGGLLVLLDFLREPASAGAHLPLAWHVFPASLAATLAAATAGVSAPLDPVWYVSRDVVAMTYLAALALCALALGRIVAGPLRPRAPGANRGAAEDIEHELN